MCYDFRIGFHEPNVPFPDLPPMPSRFHASSRIATAFAAAALALLPCARAADVTVTGVTDSADRMTVSFAGVRTDSTPAAQQFLSVLRNDLALSGWFLPTDLPSASVTLGGTVRSSSTGVSWSLDAVWNLRASTRSWSQSVSGPALRDAAHALADEMIERISGHAPMASSKILCVGRRHNVTEIYECDADGQRLRPITSDAKLCLSPNWNPGRYSFLYTSWITGTPCVYEVDLAAQPVRRRIVSNFPGMNNGAVLSPDGRRTAVILSRGGVDLYLIDPGARRITDRLTRSRRANESSPSWSPDGGSLVYVSDEGGTARCYVMNVATRRSVRMSYSSEFGENVAPEWGPDGRIAFCGRARNGRYRIFVVDGSRPSATPKAVSPADGFDYEDPSWAPDGRHVVCTRTAGYRRSLVVLDTKERGDPPRTLFSSEGDWYLPSWSDNGVARR